MIHKVKRTAFTLLELLVVIGIIGVLAGLILPSLSRARRQAKTTTCSTRLRTLGQGLTIYANEYDDVLVPHRIPKTNDEYPGVAIEGGLKYRPTFLAMLGTQLGIAPFSDPRPDLEKPDRDGEEADRQNFADEAYVCPEVPDWTDERNAAYGYNYQFLGNARLIDDKDPLSFKNWPVRYSKIKGPGKTVAIGDSLGTAANFPKTQRGGYENNGRTVNARGNEGLVLDPPIVDVDMGEVATHGGEASGSLGPASGMAPSSQNWPTLTSSAGEEDGEPARSGVDLRHGGKTNILWLDGRVSVENLESLGYWIDEDTSIGFGDLEQKQGNNRFWTGTQRNHVWVER